MEYKVALTDRLILNAEFQGSSLAGVLPSALLEQVLRSPMTFTGAA